MPFAEAPPLEFIRVYRHDTRDGVDLIGRCACGAATESMHLGLGADVADAARRLREAGCEACRVYEDARRRGHDIARRVAGGALEEIR